MGDRKGPDEQTVTTTSEVTIPGFLRPFIERSADVAEGAIDRVEDRTRGPLVAPFSDDQLTAFGIGRDLALDPESPIFAALEQLASTAAGDGFDSDEFQATFDATVRDAAPGVISSFGGRSSALADTAFERVRADAFARLANQERGRQLGAATSLPTIAQLPFGILSQIGAAQQNQAQRGLTLPLAAETDLLRAALGGLPISGLLGREGTQTQPIHSDPLGQALGLGLTAAGLFTGNPALALGGAGNVDPTLPWLN